MTTPDGAAHGPHDPDAPREPGYDPRQGHDPQGYPADPGQAYGAGPGAGPDSGYGDAGGYSPHQAQPYPGVEHGAAPSYGQQQGADHPQGWAYVPEPLSAQLPPQAESGAAYGVPAPGDAWQPGAYDDPHGAPGHDGRYGTQPGAYGQEHGRPYGAAAPHAQPHGGTAQYGGNGAADPYPSTPHTGGAFAAGDPYGPGPSGGPGYPDGDPYSPGAPGRQAYPGGPGYAGDPAAGDPYGSGGPGHPGGHRAGPGGADWAGAQPYAGDAHGGTAYDPAGHAGNGGGTAYDPAGHVGDGHAGNGGGYESGGRAGGGAQPYPHAYAEAQAPRGVEHTAVLPAYAGDAEELPQQPGPWDEASARAAAQGTPGPPARTGSPIIPPGVQPAALTAVLGLLLAGAAALGNPVLAVALLALEGLTAAGWFRLNGMWPARQGIMLAFLGGVTADIALLAADGGHATEVLLGTLGVWLLLVLVLQLRHHGSADERLSSLTATSVSTLLTVVAASLLATAVSGPGSDPVVVGTVAVAAATLVRAVRLPGGEPVSLVLSLAVGAATAWLTAPATGYGSGDAALMALACAAAALIGLRVASYDFPSRFVHFTAGVALPLTAAAPVVYALGTALS